MGWSASCNHRINSNLLFTAEESIEPVCSASLVTWCGILAPHKRFVEKPEKCTEGNKDKKNTEVLQEASIVD